MGEELPHPRRDLPKGIALQLGLGFLCKLLTRNRGLPGLRLMTPRTDAFIFAITLGYSITDLSVLQGGFNTYPLAGIYQQATAHEDGTPNNGATFGLLFIILVSSFLCVIGTILTV